MNNPWSESATAERTCNESSPKSFEDDFTTSTLPVNQPSDSEKLPDSEEYLGKLERKLNRLQGNTNTLQQLRSRREHCIEALLASDGPLEQRISDLELDQPTGATGGQQQLLRLLNPHQPLTVGEVLHLVQHDELDRTDAEEDTAGAEEGDTKSAIEEENSSSTSSSTSPPSR